MTNWRVVHLCLLQFLPDDVVGLGLGGVHRLVHHVDVEDAVGVAKKTVDLLVDEGEGVEDDGDHDHEKDLAEEGDIETDDVGSEMDPEDDIEEEGGEVVLHPLGLVDSGQE